MPDAPASAAPAAPSVPAAPPPSAAPPAAPSRPTDQPESGGWLEDAGKDFEAMDAEDESKAGGKPAAVTPPKPPEKPDEPDAHEGDKDKGKVTPPEGEKPPVKPDGKKDKTAADLLEGPEPGKVIELREAYRTLKRTLREQSPKLAAAEAKIKELETREPEDAAPLKTELDTVRKRNTELEQEIRFVNYSKSKEFTEQYQRPYLEAWNDALSDLKELTVDLGDGNTRQATQDDLLLLANLPLGQARAKANEMFGDSANDVMIHRAKIRDLSQKQAKALEDARGKAEERAKLAEAEGKTRRAEIVKGWTEANEALAKKYPNWFAPVEGDTEGNAILEKGFVLADRRFHPTAETRPKTAQEAIQLDAVLRNKAANHDRLAYRLKQANGEIAELRKALEEFEKSEPKGGQPGGQPSAKPMNWQDEAEAEIEALDKP